MSLHPSLSSPVYDTAAAFSLITIDPWAKDELFAQIENPHPGIAFAVVGPIDPWHATSPKETPVNCLLVGGDGLTIEMVRVHRGTQSLQEFWMRLSVQLSLSQGLATFGGGMRHSLQSQANSTARFRQLTNWLPATGDPLPAVLRRRFSRETQSSLEAAEADEAQYAFIQATDELQWAVDAAIEHLTVELSQLLLVRPTLRVESASTLIKHARGFGPRGISNMCQALRLDSLGLINAAAEEIRSGMKPCLADAICKGESFPKALIAYGIPAWLYRRTLNNAALNDEDCDGGLWLSALRSIAQARKGLESDDDCRCIAQHVRLVQRQVQSSTVALEHLLLQTQLGLRRTEELHSRYEAASSAICKRIAKVTGRKLEHAIVMRWLVLQPVNEFLKQPLDDVLASADAHFLRLPIEEAFNAALRQQPGIPDHFQSRGNYTLVRMDRLDAILNLGKKMGNCLAQLNTVMDFVLFGHMFFAIKVQGRTRAVFALEIDCDNSDSRHVFKVKQLEADRDAGLFEAVMYRDAWELAVCLGESGSSQAIRSYIAATRSLHERFG